MADKVHAERLARALEATGLCQPVQNNAIDDRLTVLCRVLENNEQGWIKLVEKILVTSLDEAKEVHAWKAHICRNYFIKEIEDQKRLVWGWNISIQAREVPLALDILIRVIKGQPIRSGPVPGELTEFPLHGAPPNRNAGKPGGKGVHLIGENDFSPARTK
jgi:hypothetical protein